MRSKKRLMLASIILCFCLKTIAFADIPVRIDIPYVPLTTSEFSIHLQSLCQYVLTTNGLDLAKQHADSGLKLNDIKAVCLTISNNNLSMITRADYDTLKKIRQNDTAIFQWVTSAPPTPGGVRSGSGTSTSDALSSLEKKAIEGFADFLVTRAKAEAAYYFQSKLADELCGAKSETKDYFNNLCLALGNIDSPLGMSMSLQAMGTYLQSAAKHDIENLPDMLLQKNQDLRAGRIALAAYREIRNGRSGTDIIRGFSKIDDAFCQNDPSGDTCKKIILLVTEASNILGSINKQLSNVPKQYITVGAIFEIQDIMIIDDATAFKLFKQATALGNFIDKIQDIQAKIVDLQNTPQNDFEIKNQLQKRITMAAEAVTLFIDADTWLCSNLSQPEIISISSPKLADQCQNIEKLKKISNIIDLGQKILEQDNAGNVIALMDFLAKNSITDDNLDKAKPIIPLIAEIASAQTTTDVSNIIEAAAAPVGSYEQKYKRKMFTVNAFVGAAYGTEKYEADSIHGYQTFTSLFAPVGIHATYPSDWLFPKHLGLFISLFDFGSAITSRSNDDPNVESRSNIGFKQLFAPGVFVTLGIAKTPLVLGFGESMISDLRATTTGQGQANVLRTQVFLSLDLTLFPF